MGKSVLKRKPTPSALRKKKAQQRIRKKIKQKVSKSKPNWKQAITKTYLKKDSKTAKPSRKRSREDRAKTGDDDDDEEKKTFAFSKGEDEEDGEVQSDVDEEKQERMNQRDPLLTQLFLKNLPLDTNEAELLQLFETHFGAVRRVLLVKNRISKTLAGTAFVHCGSEELANKIFESAQKNAREVAASNRVDVKGKTDGMSHHQAKRTLFKLRSGNFVAKDPFLNIRDTIFTVHRVLSRSDAHEAVSSLVKKKKRTKVAADDPRNLYLLQEGLITADMPAARDLHPQYMQMILDDYEARKEKLLNSNFFVSRTRLSVRNLPRKLTENDVRRLFAEHARKYLKGHPEDTDKGKWGKYGPIKNVKVLRDNGGISRGYGFVEFVNHNVALHVLRGLNNNPTLFGDNRRLMVSFSVENIAAVQKLQRIKELRKKQYVQAPTPSSTRRSSSSNTTRRSASTGIDRKKRRTQST